jgi:flagellar protein FlgJ
MSADGQKQALKQAAGQFEAVFMNMLLKSMRDSLPKDGMTESDTTRTYTSMLDQQMSQKLSDKGMGLADMIVKQLDKKMIDPAALKDLQSGASGSTSTLQRLKSATSAASGGATDPAMLSGAPKDFVQARWADAQAAEQSSGVPAQFILGQAALESGWGKRDIKYADGSTSHNLFGIKAGGNWKGATVDATTTEYVGGVARKSVEKFRAYSSYAESFADYANLLKSNPRYAKTLSAGTDAAQFATSLQKAGYATDPNYAKKLTSVIQQTLRAVA